MHWIYWHFNAVLNEEGEPKEQGYMDLVQWLEDDDYKELARSVKLHLAAERQQAACYLAGKKCRNSAVQQAKSKDFIDRQAASDDEGSLEDTTGRPGLKGMGTAPARAKSPTGSLR